MSQLLDGELPPQDAQRLNAYLEANPDQMDWMESNALVTQASFPTRDTARDSTATWAAVHAAIAKEDHQEDEGKVIAFPKLFRNLSIAAAVAVVGTIAWLNIGPADAPFEESYASIEFVDTDIPDASPIVYTDEESGWNVVWVEQFNAPQEETS